ncbi:MAG TPA: class I SAM-dependent methyltransferase [Bdellovibrionota bacterium]|jgi:ubiquinone/menaquinone biosynthesis C-methylase UbiE
MGKKKKSSASGVAEGYIHGFTKTEQDRLFQQARVHEDYVFSSVDLSACKSILEVGSGVGAQTQILLERFPEAKIHCVDASAEQAARAKSALKQAVGEGRVNVTVADALHLPFGENSFDGAFLCWFLEHVQNPVGILAEAKRVLKPGGVIYCNEVFNSTFYMHPYSPATLKYWFEFNDYQWSLKGDPFVGGKLANYLMASGFQNITTKVITHQYDNRMPKKRAAFIDYWTDLLLSGATSLIAAKRVTPEIVKEMREESERLKNAPDSVIFYSWIQARAEAF